MGRGPGGLEAWGSGSLEARCASWQMRNCSEWRMWIITFKKKPFYAVICQSVLELRSAICWPGAWTRLAECLMRDGQGLKHVFFFLVHVSLHPGRRNETWAAHMMTTFSQFSIATKSSSIWGRLCPIWPRTIYMPDTPAWQNTHCMCTSIHITQLFFGSFSHQYAFSTLFVITFDKSKENSSIIQKSSLTCIHWACSRI